MKKILRKLGCLLGEHEWICKAEQGIKPVEGESFESYAIMYCDGCGKVSKLSRRLLNKSLNL